MNELDIFQYYLDDPDSYKSYDDCYNELIKTNNIKIFPFCLDSDGIWKRLELDWMLEYFIEKEEYEKCIIIKKNIDKYFIASPKKQKKLNIKLRKHHE